MRLKACFKDGLVEPWVAGVNNDVGFYFCNECNKIAHIAGINNFGGELSRVVEFGNCLLGPVDVPVAVAAVAIESFGVRAHVGYVVVTWFGRGGWGTLDRFTKEPGVRTLHEAWRENSDAIVDELARRWPGSEALVLASWQRDDVSGFGREVAAWMKERSIPEADARELAGLLWDRDAVVYLGDPSWQVRVQRQLGTTVDPWSAMAGAGRVTGSSPAPAPAPSTAP